MEDLIESAVEDVCRDYLRNVCNRGKKCRYIHPPQQPPSFIPDSANTLEERIKFCRMTCHDFQNGSCERDECKYMHITKEDQDKFLVTGFVPSSLLEEALKRSVIPFLPGEIPVCKDYLNGECRRGKSCRFRHLSHCKYRRELDLLFGVERPENPPVTDCETVKRVCLSYPLINLRNNSSSCLHEEHIMTLQEENTRLKKQMLDLKKQLSDLTAANEFLLDQNAGLRFVRKSNGNMVAIAQAPQPIAVATALPVSISSVAAGPQMTLNTVSASPQQLVPAVSCTAATNGHQQQLMAVTGGSTTAAILATPCSVPVPVPVSVAQVSCALTPVPVSLATVSMATAAVPLATSVVAAINR